MIMNNKMMKYEQKENEKKEVNINHVVEVIRKREVEDIEEVIKIKEKERKVIVEETQEQNTKGRNQ